MKILDIDMDYFLNCDIHIGSDDSIERLSEEDYGNEVWSEAEVRNFLESNLGLSKSHKIPGRIVVGHNESLFFWQELISEGKLITPFEVIHVDTHADLGLGYASWGYICKELLDYPVKERPYHAVYSFNGKEMREGIGDYLLFAIAYRMISSLTYCGNPHRECSDYILNTLKNFEEKIVLPGGNPVRNTIQLLGIKQEFPKNNANRDVKQRFIDNSLKEPEVPLLIIPRVEDVQYNGNFDFAVLAQSPNYTPASADFIMEVFKDYIEEI